MKKFALAALMMFSATAWAMSPGAPGKVDLIVKSGSDSNSVYSKLFAQMAAVCTSPAMVDSPASGSIQALDSILNNEANLAFVQSDVVLGRKIIENDPGVDKVRVFMPLFNSELHILTARSDTNINRFSDLFQKKVGTYGGAYITARILFGATNIQPFSLVQFNSEADALNAIKAGTVDAVMIVAGQPASWAKNISGANYKLVPFDRMDVLGKLGSYSQTSLRYPNLSQTTVPSVAVQVNLITYDYKSRDKVNNLAKLKSCINAHIDDLRETTGNHPKWNEIKPMAKVTYWPMFNPGK